MVCCMLFLIMKGNCYGRMILLVYQFFIYINVVFYVVKWFFLFIVNSDSFCDCIFLIKVQVYFNNYNVLYMYILKI